MFGDYEADNARATLIENETYKQRIEDLRIVLNTPEGERVMRWVLERCGTFEPAWTDKNARLAKQVVLKDFGNEILDDIAVASSDKHDSIQRNMRVQRKLEEALLTVNRV